MIKRPKTQSYLSIRSIKVLIKVRMPNQRRIKLEKNLKNHLIISQWRKPSRIVDI